MKAVKLTDKEREIFEHMKSLPGGKLRQHVKGTNTVCFRLLDAEMNPIKNYQYGKIHSLIEKGVLHLEGHDYVLTATSEKRSA